MNRIAALVAVVLAVAVATPTVLAQQGESEDRQMRRDTREKRRKDRRDLRKGAGDDRRERRKERRDRRKERREDRREGREDRKDRREDRRDMRKDRRDDRRDTRKEIREDRRDMRKEIREDRRDLRKDRRDRRADRRQRRRERRRQLMRRVLVSSFGPDRGPAGTRVVVRGRNFAPNMKLTVGGVAVTKLKIKDDRIIFKVPDGAGDGVIAVEGPGGRKVFVGRFDYKGKWDRAERRRLRAERRKRARARWLERRSKLAKSKEERRKRWEAEQEERRRDRAERRRRRAEKMRKRWQRQFLASPEVQAEMALHAQRAARLERMRRLAEVDDREKLVVRIEILLEREDERHDRRMGFLKATLKI